jgi:hypothetical protein
MAAGVLGGLMTEPLRLVGWLIAQALGDDDDGLTWETEFKAGLFQQAKTWGATDKQAASFTDMIASGLPRWSSDYGVDLASRVGTNHLLFMPVQNKSDTLENEYVERLVQLVGPAGAIVRNVFKGMDKVKQGRAAEGIEGMLPKGMRDVARAVRRSDSPQLSVAGQETLPEHNLMQTLWQGLGFTPAGDARRYDDMRAQYDYETTLTKRRTNLTRKFYRAEPAERAEIWRNEIMPWNRQHARDAKLRISYQQLMQGTQRLRESEQKAVGGMTPKLDSTRRAIPYAGRE